MTKEEIINEYNNYFNRHEQFDEYNTCIKLNRSEFLSLVGKIYDDSFKGVSIDITPKSILPEPIDYTIK